MIEQLFGFPMYRTSLKKKKYERKKIISAIEENFKKDPIRNNWDSEGDLSSVMHHSYNDKNNNFIEPDYKSLIPIYNKQIEIYLKKIGFKNNFSYKFEIINYTCMWKINIWYLMYIVIVIFQQFTTFNMMIQQIILRYFITEILNIYVTI